MGLELVTIVLNVIGVLAVIGFAAAIFVLGGYGE